MAASTPGPLMSLLERAGSNRLVGIATQINPGLTSEDLSIRMVGGDIYLHILTITICQ